ncbi:MAG: NAD-dependent epimerase/dehydratase family protein [Actinomycetota bacterium]|nr:NAD-dependent epimerase/dehydratase family protein [Actinomycetota bacterium]
MKKKILLLGGGGFLGANLTLKLAESYENVSVFEHPAATTKNIAAALPKVKVISGDFTSREDLESAVKGMDIIFHLISTTTVNNSTANPAFDISTNLIPTLNLLEIAVKCGVSRIIFPSSGGTVYGPTTQNKITESHRTEPISSYGIHKLAIEKYLGMFNKLYGLDYRILRLSNPYGARQWGSQNQGIIGVFCRRIIEGLPIEVWGDGKVVRDYLFVEDATDAFIKIMLDTSPHRLFNIGTGRGTSVNAIIQILRGIAGKDFAIQYTPSRPVDIPRNVLDPTLAKQVLGWQPTIELNEGIERTLTWFEKNTDHIKEPTLLG